MHINSPWKGWESRRRHMKITLINTSDSAGGAAIACRRLGMALRGENCPAQMLVKERTTDLPWVRSSKRFWWRTETTHYLEKLCFLPFEKNASVRFQFSTASFGVSLSRHSAVQWADLLHLHWINKGFLSLKGLQDLAATGKPLVWTCHDMWPFTGGCHYAGTCNQYQQPCGQCPFLARPSESDISHRIWLQKKALYDRLNLQVVTCSEWLSTAARSSSLFRNKPIHAIPNPIDTDRFAPAGPPLIKENATFTLLFQAMNIDDERKGFAYLLRAFQLLKTRFPTTAERLKILLFGKVLPETIARIPFPVEHAGILTREADIIAAYRKADLFVIPSLEENLPNTVMESLSCGVPVVGFASGGIPEMIRHMYNGYLAPVGDAQALATGIHTLLSEPHRLAQLADQARRWALEHYAAPVVAKKYMEVYRDSLSLRP